MKIIRAKTAGFCFGVSHALRLLDKEVVAVQGQGKEADKGQGGGRLITLGPIIHNPLVMDDYAAKGVLCIESIAEITKGDRVVIRAHGIPRETEEYLVKTGAKIIDATCPKVKKAQLAIASSVAQGCVLLLFGEKEHPEVQGLVSYAAGTTFVFSQLEELYGYALAPDCCYVLAAQTTQDKNLFAEARDYLTGALQQRVVVLETICDATRRRQEEAIAISQTVEAMIVVGGRNSGNTRRLADVSSAEGIPAFLAEQPKDLQGEDLTGFSVIGLTAGASTPDSHIEAMQKFLEKRNGSK